MDEHTLMTDPPMALLWVGLACIVVGMVLVVIAAFV